MLLITGGRSRRGHFCCVFKGQPSQMAPSMRRRVVRYLPSRPAKALGRPPSACSEIFAAEKKNQAARSRRRRKAPFATMCGGVAKQPQRCSRVGAESLIPRAARGPALNSHSSSGSKQIGHGACRTSPPRLESASRARHERGILFLSRAHRSMPMGEPPRGLWLLLRGGQRTRLRRRPFPMPTPSDRPSACSDAYPLGPAAARRRSPSACAPKKEIGARLKLRSLRSNASFRRRLWLALRLKTRHTPALKIAAMDRAMDRALDRAYPSPLSFGAAVEPKPGGGKPTSINRPLSMPQD